MITKLEESRIRAIKISWWDSKGNPISKMHHLVIYASVIYIYFCYFSQGHHVRLGNNCDDCNSGGTFALGANLSVPWSCRHCLRIFHRRGGLESRRFPGEHSSTHTPHVVPENIHSKCQCEKPEWNWGDRLLLESSHIFQHLPAKIAIYLLLNTGAIPGTQGQRLSPLRGQVVRTSDISAQPKDCVYECSLQDTGAGPNILANLMNFI